MMSVQKPKSNIYQIRSTLTKCINVVVYIPSSKVVSTACPVHMLNVHYPSDPQIYSLRQLHIKLATHRVELRLGSHVRILVQASVAGNLSGQFLGVLHDTRNLSVDLPSHFVQEVRHRLDEPPVTSEFEPAKVATP